MKTFATVLAVLIGLAWGTAARADVTAYFRMEEGAGVGTADDVAGNDPITWGTGIGWAGTGAPVTGSSDSLNFTDGMATVTPGTTPGQYISQTSPFSISFWLKPNDYSADFKLLSYMACGGNADYPFMIGLSDYNGGGANDYRGIVIGTGSTTGVPATYVRQRTPGISLADMVDGDWHNVVITYNGLNSLDGSNYAIYFDGQSEDLVAASNLIASPSTIFGRTAGGTGSYNGFMDEFAVFDSELTAPQIAALYAGADAYSVVPEPTTLALLSMGLCGLLCMRRKRS